MKLTELAQAIEDGEKIEVLAGKGWEPFNMICTFNYAKQKLEEDRIRIAPEKKPVDLSVLINSGIDCEFSHGGLVSSLPVIAKLIKIRDNDYMSEGWGAYRQCRPRMNHWHSWKGGECPLPQGLKVDVMIINGVDVECKALDFFGTEVQKTIWAWSVSYMKIIAFRVTGVADTHRMPWEKS